MSKILTPEHLHLSDYRDFITAFNILMISQWKGREAHIRPEEILNLAKMIVKRRTGEHVALELDPRFPEILQSVGWKIAVNGDVWHVSF